MMPAPSPGTPHIRSYKRASAAGGGFWYWIVLWDGHAWNVWDDVRSMSFQWITTEYLRLIGATK